MRGTAGPGWSKRLSPLRQYRHSQPVLLRRSREDGAARAALFPLRPASATIPLSIYHGYQEDLERKKKKKKQTQPVLLRTGIFGALKNQNRHNSPIFTVPKGSIFLLSRVIPLTCSSKTVSLCTLTPLPTIYPKPSCDVPPGIS